MPIYLLCIKYTCDINFNYDEINDEIALNQLREELLISYNLSFSRNELSFIYKDKNFTLSFVNNKLLLQPGTQIYLNDIDDLYFENKNNCIYAIYQRENNKYERIIADAKGFYIEYFIDCLTSDDIDNIVEE